MIEFNDSSRSVIGIVHRFVVARQRTSFTDKFWACLDTVASQNVPGT